MRLAVEWDDHAVACYQGNFPATPIHHGDVAALMPEDVLTRAGLQVGELDVLDGSPPCQGFSTSGSRQIDDPRNSLFREFVRLLRGLRPRAFVMENVGGMVRGKMRLVFAEALRELRASGYAVRCRLLNAWWYGVPQSRQRVFFIGARDDLGIDPTHPVPERDTPITAQEAFTGLVETDDATRLSSHALHMWSQTLPGFTFKKGHSNHTAWLNWKKMHPDQPPPARLPNSWFNWAKLHPNRPSPTLSKTMTLTHWAAPRLLSVSECLRISSFPDSFALSMPGSTHAKYARIGNSVPPLLARAVAAHVRDTILTRASVRAA